MIRKQARASRLKCRKPGEPFHPFSRGPHGKFASAVRCSNGVCAACFLQDGLLGDTPGSAE